MRASAGGFDALVAGEREYARHYRRSRRDVARDATFGDGWVDEAFLLDGNGDFIDVPDHPTLNVGTSDFTVDLWVRFDSTQGEQVLIEKFVANDVGWTLTKLPDNTVRLAITADANIDSAPQNLPLDTWIFFCGST